MPKPKANIVTWSDDEGLTEPSDDEEDELQEEEEEEVPPVQNPSQSRRNSLAVPPIQTNVHTQPQASSSRSNPTSPTNVHPPTRTKTTRPSTQAATQKSKERRGLKSVATTLRPGRNVNYSISSLYYWMKDTEHGIDLDAEYQRGIVWKDEKQSGLIDSIFHNFHIPPLVFVVIRFKDGTERRICVDGKQRLTSIRRFMQGEIPYKDPTTNKNLWYTSPSGVKSKRKTISEGMQQTFCNKQIACYEYEDVTPEQEREIFQRVQMGVALSPAERLAAINGPYADLVRDMKNLIVNFQPASDPSSDEYPLAKFLDWGSANGRNFMCLAQILYLFVHGAKLKDVPSHGRLHTFLSQTPDGLKTLKIGVTRTIKAFCEILLDVNDDEEDDETIGPGKGVCLSGELSVLEFVMSVYLVYLHHGKDKETSTRYTLAQLADAIAQMRAGLKGVGEKKFETQNFKQLLGFVTKQVPKLTLRKDFGRRPVQLPRQAVDGPVAGKGAAATGKKLKQSRSETPVVPASAAASASNTTGTTTAKKTPRKRKQDEADMSDFDEPAPKVAKTTPKNAKATKASKAAAAADDDDDAYIIPVKKKKAPPPTAVAPPPPPASSSAPGPSKKANEAPPTPAPEELIPLGRAHAAARARMTSTSGARGVSKAKTTIRRSPKKSEGEAFGSTAASDPPTTPTVPAKRKAPAASSTAPITSTAQPGNSKSVNEQAVKRPAQARRTSSTTFRGGAPTPPHSSGTPAPPLPPPPASVPPPAASAPPVLPPSAVVLPLLASPGVATPGPAGAPGTTGRRPLPGRTHTTPGPNSNPASASNSPTIPQAGDSAAALFDASVPVTNASVVGNGSGSVTSPVRPGGGKKYISAFTDAKAAAATAQRAGGGVGSNLGGSTLGSMGSLDAGGGGSTVGPVTNSTSGSSKFPKFTKRTASQTQLQSPEEESFATAPPGSASSTNANMSTSTSPFTFPTDPNLFGLRSSSRTPGSGSESQSPMIEPSLARRTSSSVPGMTMVSGQVPAPLPSNSMTSGSGATGAATNPNSYATTGGVGSLATPASTPSPILPSHSLSAKLAPSMPTAAAWFAANPGASAGGRPQGQASLQGQVLPQAQAAQGQGQVQAQVPTRDPRTAWWPNNANGQNQS